MSVIGSEGHPSIRSSSDATTTPTCIVVDTRLHAYTLKTSALHLFLVQIFVFLDGRG